jgi:hypothetical protein
MTQLTFDEWACRNTQAKLDFYIDNELTVETNLELVRHCEHCAACAGEAAARRAMRDRLKVAVRTEGVPPGLEKRVRERLRQSPRANSTRWTVMAIAAAVVICFGTWFASERIGPVPARIAAVLGIGVGDHVHCAVIRQAVTKPVNQDKLPVDLKPLLAIARQQVPADMRLAVAHQCTSEGRSFIHMTFRNEQRLLSVILTRRHAGESLPGADGIYAGRMDRFQAAVFESGEFLVYTISDLSGRENLRILTAMAPAIRSALQKGEKV